MEMWPKEEGVITQCPASSGKFEMSSLLLEPLTPLCPLAPPLPVQPPDSGQSPLPSTPGAQASGWLKLGLGGDRQEAMGCRVSVSGGNSQPCP